jgi:hypothetical protein
MWNGLPAPLYALLNLETFWQTHMVTMRFLGDQSTPSSRCEASEYALSYANRREESIESYQIKYEYLTQALFTNDHHDTLSSHP